MSAKMDFAGQAGNGAELMLPPSFPTGEYTPFGYLDNPQHSMVAHRSGVIRSVPPLGMGYWLRPFRGSYGSGVRGHVNYLSILKLTIAFDDVRLVGAQDFDPGGVPLVSKYHSKHLLSYDWQHRGLTFAARYFLARENTLACLIELENQGAAAKDVYVHALHVYGLWETRWWGSDGIGMRYKAAHDAGLTAIWAYGDYFALGANVPSVAHKATAVRDEVGPWLRANNLGSRDDYTVRGPGPLHTIMTYRLTVPAGERQSALICLCRGPNEPAALAELETARTTARSRLEAQLDADESFWSRCPQLEGDWPVTWKRGWVYDWETLRMNVRPPVGIFRHPWDGMQVHSPRFVLGEASVDMFALSHADPELAKEVLLGAFVDAPMPNVPCCREDGSMNMIAADGEACGTAPSWCFPLHVIRSIYAATHDEEWLSTLYPHLKTYVEWWLANRADEHGWLHCHCDWESGQDGSKRFPEGEGGVADAVRTVDVEASMAEALRNLEFFARVAGDPADAKRWAELAEARIRSTQDMFVDGWFRDFDTRTSKPFITPDYIDIMMLTPLTCGIATPEQIAAVRPRFQYFRENPYPWLEWPSFFLVYAEAAWTAGVHEIAAEVTADIADRIYPRLDVRTPRFDDLDKPFAYRLPGVANEYWPIKAETEPGGECYGWGATLPLHILRSIVGLRETVRTDANGIEFHLAPTLPQRLLVSQRTYTARNLHFRDVTLTTTYVVDDARRLRVTLEYALPQDGRLIVCDAGGQPVAASTEEGRAGTLAFDADNGHVFTCRVE